MDSVDASDRDTLMAFLQGQNPYGDYAPASGQIVGILKNMKDEMDKSLGGIVATEEAAAKGFTELKAAKTSEIQAATKAIESKTTRSGELAVEIVNAKNEKDNTTKDMEESQAFMANLSTACATKAKEYEGREKTRQEELTAISEVISMLNDDDALDLFKDSLGKGSFLQRDVTAGQKAKALLSKVIAGKRVPVALNLLAHTAIARLGGLQKEGVKVDFSKVIKMIDDMVALLGQEQKDDDHHLGYCHGEIDGTEDSIKDLKSTVAGVENAISETQSKIAEYSDEIAKLEQEIKDLDKAVAEATEQRKAEHKEYIEGEELSAAAVDLLGKAKNRLHKFYNPNLYKAPTTKAPTEEERIAAGAFVQVKKTSLRGANKVWARPDDFEAQQDLDSSIGTKYEKKGQKANSVVALVDMLVKELETDMQEAKHEETTSQRDYSAMMTESQEKRAGNVKSITGLQGAKADGETSLEAHKNEHIMKSDELANTEKYLTELHASCDFLIANYDVRKAARTGESESLKNAKAVLSGADFSL
jgi:chromosome segregation ATPase